MRGLVCLLLISRCGAASADVAPVGFIGLGIMGQGMARCLLSSGTPLHVWSRRSEVSEALAAEEELGASVTVASSPAAVIAACERTYLMLSTPESCEQVYTQEGGVLDGVIAGKQLVDCATLRPEDMASLAARVRERGGTFLEAPVSGSKAPAAQGQLIFMTAGDEDTYKQSALELEAMGKLSVFCGREVGLATKMKLCVNMVMGAQLAAISEGLALADDLGLDLGDVQAVLDSGAMASPMLKLKGPLMAKREFATAFPLKYALKDLRFALKLAGELEQPLPLPVSAAATAAYTEADEGAGLGESDFSAVHEVVRAAAQRGERV